MHKIWFTVVTAALLSFSGHLLAKPEQLPFFKANYNAFIKGVPLKATREFRSINNNQNLGELHFSASSWLASLSETSQFSWENNHIKPIRFTHTRTIIGSEEKKMLSFDWTNQQIVSTEDETVHIIKNPAQALDRLSFQLQLQYDLLTGVDDYQYRIADKNRIKEYQFEILGQEITQTSLGQLNALKVKVIRTGKKRHTYLWLAQDWQNLLIRLEQYKNDDKEFELQLINATVSGRSVSGI
ncbi:MAG: DUF3108 domain-containing protein [Pseudomonadota bacterium]